MLNQRKKLQFLKDVSCNLRIQSR